MNKNQGIILNSSSWARTVGPYRLATFLKDHNWECDIVDYFEFWNPVNLENYLNRKITKNTKWVGISYTWMAEKHTKVIELVRFLKRIKPELLIIIGGQSPYYHDLEADYYIFGYAEHALLKVLDYEFGKGLPPFYNKLFNGKYIDALHNYPSYDLKDYSIKFQNTDFIDDTDVLTIAFSRGCKFKCDFCTFPFIGIKEDTSSSEEILYRELMENYQKWGTKNYYITDETLNDRTDKLIKLKNVITQLDFEPNLTGFVRADLLKSHPEHIELLAESRVWGQYYGVETFCREAGKSIGKGQNPDVVKDNILKVREYFQKNVGLYRGTVSMIAGLPYESLDSMRSSQKWLEENWSDQLAYWYPLQILNSPNGVGALSAMGKDFSKYGYRETTNSEKLIKDNKTRALYDNEVSWENDHTNVFEVRKLIREEFTFKFKLGGFGLWPLLSYVPIDTLINMELDENSYKAYPVMDRISKYIFLKYQS